MIQKKEKKQEQRIASATKNEGKNEEAQTNICFQFVMFLLCTSLILFH
jgi:hypothetical protein